MTQQVTDFREGDLVEAVKGETVIRGRIRDNGVGPFIDAPDMWTRALEDEDFSLTLIDRPAPKVELPTEPGYYRSGGKSGEMQGTFLLSVNGQWWWVGNKWAVAPEQNTPETVAEHHAPLTRLEPSTDTARRVIAAVRKAYHTDDPTYWGNLDRIAREFGVTQ